MPTVRNLVIENMTVDDAKRVLDIRGFPGAQISGVRIHKSRFAGIRQEDAIQEADVKLTECEITRR
jgi:hypothetical protein